MHGENMKPICITGLNAERTDSNNPPTATTPTRIFLTLSEMPNVVWVRFFLDAQEETKEDSWTKAEVLRDGIVIECPLEQGRVQEKIDLLKRAIAVANAKYAARVNDQADEATRQEADRIARRAQIDSLGKSLRF
jgi:hypothetical protein